MNLESLEAALEKRESQLRESVDWDHVRRRSRALARRPYWSLFGTGAVSIANLLFGWLADAPLNLFVGFGALVLIWGQVERAKTARERLANLATDNRELFSGYVHDLGRLSASRIFDTFYWILWAPRMLSRVGVIQSSAHSRPIPWVEMVMPRIDGSLESCSPCASGFVGEMGCVGWVDWGADANAGSPAMPIDVQINKAVIRITVVLCPLSSCGAWNDADDSNKSRFVFGCIEH